MFQVRCHATGELFENYKSYHEAENCVIRFMDEDKREGSYEDGFYEIYDTEKEEIVDVW